MEDLIQTCRHFLEAWPQEIHYKEVKRVLDTNPQTKRHTDLISQQLDVCGPVYLPNRQAAPPKASQNFKAVCWNLERGKNYDGIQSELSQNPRLKDADFYFLTEVDWGMARSENRNITAELGEALDLNAYFAPSYFNFTKGHGAERDIIGKNKIGLHGKSILSRYPLDTLATTPMPNITNKLTAKDARLGQKRALVGELQLGSQKLTLACTHLDAYSSPLSRKKQLATVTKTYQDATNVLLAGDWNTNTLNSTSTARMIPHLIYQLLMVRPVPMLTRHHPFPDRFFDRPIFKMLEKYQYDYKNCNVLGEATYDLISDNQELGAMAGDQFPQWTLNYINRLITKAGGNIGLKLDWFATKNLICTDKQVVRLTQKNGTGAKKLASDHHPIVLSFNLAATI